MIRICRLDYVIMCHSLKCFNSPHATHYIYFVYDDGEKNVTELIYFWNKYDFGWNDPDFGTVNIKNEYTRATQILWKFPKKKNKYCFRYVLWVYRMKQAQASRKCYAHLKGQTRIFVCHSIEWDFVVHKHHIFDTVTITIRRDWMFESCGLLRSRYLLAFIDCVRKTSGHYSPYSYGTY